MHESDLQQKCGKYLRKEKIYFDNIHPDGYTGKGSPDIVACIKGRYVAFELKVGNNNLQDDQIVKRRKIISNGGLHFSPYTLEEFIEIVQHVKETNN